MGTGKSQQNISTRLLLLSYLGGVSKSIATELPHYPSTTRPATTAAVARMRPNAFVNVLLSDVHARKYSTEEAFPTKPCTDNCDDVGVEQG